MIPPPVWSLLGVTLGGLDPPCPSPTCCTHLSVIEFLPFPADGVTWSTALVARTLGVELESIIVDAGIELLAKTAGTCNGPRVRSDLCRIDGNLKTSEGKEPGIDRRNVFGSQLSTSPHPVGNILILT